MRCKMSVVGFVVGAIVSLSGIQAHAAEVSSTWSTDFGKLDLTVTDGLQVSGSYPDYDGRLRGNMSQNGEISAYWMQPSSERRCATKVYGTYYWGLVLWSVKANGDLTGKWSYCDERLGSSGAWNGRLTAGPSPMVMLQNASKSGSTKGLSGATAGTAPNPEDAVLDLLENLIRNARN